MSGRIWLSWATLVSAAGGLGLALAGAETAAQVVDPSSSYGGAPDPNPYYIGVSAALRHSSNVYQVPDGPGDAYVVGSLLGGFNQQLGRQRVYGNASVSDNRYKTQDALNNTSYSVYGGLAWETIENLSGNLNVALNRNLAVPAASPGIPPSQTLNLSTIRSVDGAARWGGPSLFTLEARANYSDISYSDPTYASQESNLLGGSLGGYYHSGSPLRVGLAARVNRTRTPKALTDPITGNYVSTQLDGRNIDLLLDYDVTGQVVGNARLSYTRQTNAYLGTTAFSGITGGVALNWTVTGKTSVRFDAAHDAGYNSQAYNTFIFTPTSSGISLTPILGFYSNNQITDSAGLSANYLATAKITATANLRYLRARSTPVLAVSPLPDTVDISKIAALGANYAITRSWGAACDVAFQTRAVTGGQNYSYDVKSVGCSTQFTWP